MCLRNKNFSQNRSFKNLLLLYLWGQQSPKVPKFFETLQENFPLLLLWGRYEHLLVNFPSYFLGGDGLSEFQRIFLKLFFNLFPIQLWGQMLNGMPKYFKIYKKEALSKQKSPDQPTFPSQSIKTYFQFILL